jgi:hypothetical protein
MTYLDYSVTASAIKEEHVQKGDLTATPQLAE